MIIFKRGFCCLLMALLVDVAVAQNADRAQEIADRLAEVQQMIDKEISTITLLEKQLNRAVDGKDSSQIDRLREEIKPSWDRVHTLKDLKHSIEELVKEFPDVKQGSEFVETDPRGRRFDNDSSSMDRPKGVGFFREDGEMPAEGKNRRENPRQPEKPTRAGGRGGLQPPPPNLRPGDQMLEDAAASGPEEPGRPAGDAGKPPTDSPRGSTNKAPNSSKRLESLRRSHDELIAAGEFDMAAQVMELIREEKKRIAEENKNARSGNNQRPQRGVGGGAAKADEPARSGETSREKNSSNRPDTVTGDDKLDETVKNMKDELDRLREELRKLRDQGKASDR